MDTSLYQSVKLFKSEIDRNATYKYFNSMLIEEMLFYPGVFKKIISTIQILNNGK